jgi:hypothetical protein
MSMVKGEVKDMRVSCGCPADDCGQRPLLWVLQVAGSNPAAPTNQGPVSSTFFKSDSDVILTLGFDLMRLQQSGAP